MARARHRRVPRGADHRVRVQAGHRTSSRLPHAGAVSGLRRLHRMRHHLLGARDAVRGATGVSVGPAARRALLVDHRGRRHPAGTTTADGRNPAHLSRRPLLLPRAAIRWPSDPVDRGHRAGPDVRGGSFSDCDGALCLSRHRPRLARRGRHSGSLRTFAVPTRGRAAGRRWHQSRHVAGLASGLRRVRSHRCPGLSPVLVAGVHLQPIQRNRTSHHDRSDRARHRRGGSGAGPEPCALAPAVRLRGVARRTDDAGRAALLGAGWLRCRLRGR